MKKHTILLLLINVLIINAQDQKKLGCIVYEKHTFIGNKHLKLSDSILEKRKAKFKKFVIKHIDSVNPNKFINSIPKTELEVSGGDIKCWYTLDLYENVYESKSICSNVNYSNNVERYQQIHRETLKGNSVIRNVENNSYKIGQKFNVRELELSHNYEIIENRNKTKIIEGFRCFQVVLKRKSITNPHLTVYDYEIYVTEEIKLNYNPVWNYKEFLGKYYPLEIKKKPREEVMSQVITWKIKKLYLPINIYDKK
ncbi:hypothetical protein [uncultured Kordia sp.]|uniref:hypothetical protein n=1 Tax=uncultured Kordia sp. TaxID=507699 RepID=UPI002627A86C|nr:hypothetical protein [uncultured Kordia sp.]